MSSYRAKGLSKQSLMLESQEGHTHAVRAECSYGKLYDIYHCCVYSKKLLMMDRGTVRNTQFHSKNKFEKSVHLPGFIIRIYHDARSPGRQTYIFPFQEGKSRLRRHSNSEPCRTQRRLRLRRHLSVRCELKFCV